MRFLMEKILRDIAKKLDIEISDEQLKQFRIFYDYMLEVNEVMNLTAITDMNEIVLKHFIDSISILKFYKFEKGMSIIDVGTGAGFPGIPLAIMLPEVNFTLMDSLNKRIRFLNDVVEKCQLNNVTCIHGRAEEMGSNTKYREKYDVCVSRAVADLSVLMEYCSPFVKVNGNFISYKSVLIKEELTAAGNAEKLLNCSLDNQFEFIIPDSEYSRCFLVYCNKELLPEKYPRKNGITKKKPL